MGVPGIHIIGSSAYHDVGQLLYDVVKNSKCPTLFVENKTLYPQVLKVPDSKMRIGDLFFSEINGEKELSPTISLKFDQNETPAVTLIAYGGMASIAVEAAINTFYEEEIFSEILIPSAIKPFPIDTIINSIRKSKKAIIVEESVKEGGWGSELSCQIYEGLFENLECAISRVGAAAVPIPSSSLLEKQVLPQISDIEKEILEITK